MTAANRNIELKARCHDLERAAAAASAVGATRVGELRQRDTYFRVARGRLKLRESAGRPAELIAYQRGDELELRNSDYYVVAVNDATALKAALSMTLGVRGEVRKRRELWMFHNVRIHLDDVAGLGTFVEFEAVISEADGEAVSRERLARLTEALAVRDEDCVAVSYSDLLEL